MHFLGPDQLHGFESQLAVDIHAEQRHALFAWDAADGPTGAAREWTHVAEAGAGTSRVIEADDQVERAALAYLSAPERAERPFALCVGFIAPHDPWFVPEPYFSMYYPNVDMPTIPAGHLENLPPAARALRERHRMAGPFTDEQIRRTRAAYYGMITRLDEQIGRLLTRLDELGLAENTVVIHTSDHGEMLGEHGLWRKSNFYEQSVHIPLQIRLPGNQYAGRWVNEGVSLVDVTATLLDLGGVDAAARDANDLDGTSLIPGLAGTAQFRDDVFSEYLAHGNDRPRAMLKRGDWKLSYGYVRDGEPQVELYDLGSDPGEFSNLADRAEFRARRESMTRALLAHWNPEEIERRVVRSQRQRFTIERAAGRATF
jgi:choline-sulfatase